MRKTSMQKKEPRPAGRIAKNAFFEVASVEVAERLSKTSGLPLSEVMRDAMHRGLKVLWKKRHQVADGVPPFKVKKGMKLDQADVDKLREMVAMKRHVESVYLRASLDIGLEEILKEGIKNE